MRNHAFYRFTASICFILFAHCSFSQTVPTGVVSGKVIDGAGNLPIEYAAITAKSVTDSSKVFGAITNKAGEFKISNLGMGSYNLRISYVGYQSISRSIKLNSEMPEVETGILALEAVPIGLNAVTVTAEKAPVTLKKDTVEFNAGSFKTRPDATTEELLKKLPGVQIDKDGNITVGGQKVERLTVDGKDFFGTDPKTATRNLPADAIDKIQVVDSQTKEAKATGVDDGQREKVLNLTIKKDKKRGWFGNATASAGNNDRYNGYLSANHFKNDLQLAILSMSNNINESNFSYNDLSSFAGGDLGSVFAPPGGGNFSISNNNGRTTIGGSGVFDNAAKGLVKTSAGGVNFSNSWGEKKNLKFSGSYFTYFSNGDQRKISNVQDLANSSVYLTSETGILNTDNRAHRANMQLEFHPDTLVDLTFRPNVIFNTTNYRNNRLFASGYVQGNKVNDGTQNLDQDVSTPALFGEFIALRRFKSKKGSVSLRLNGTYSEYNTDWTNISGINQYQNGTALIDNTNQQADQETNTKGYTINGNIVRRISKEWNTSLTYTYNEANNLASQVTHDYSPVSGRYEMVVADLSNQFDYKNWYQAARIGFILNKKAITYNISGGVQQSGINGQTLGSTGLSLGGVDKNYYHFLPQFSFSYKPKNNRTVQFNYRTALNMPPVSNLQPVQNNTNPLYQRQGNADLEPRYSHRISVNYNTYKPGTNLYWNGYFLYNYSLNAITNNTRIEDGVQYVKPVNVDGNYLISTGTNFGFPFRIKELTSNFGLAYFKDHSKNFINSAQNVTNRSSYSTWVNLNYAIEEKLNLSLGTSVEYNTVNNLIRDTYSDTYYTLGSSANTSYEFLKGLRIEADITHTGNLGRNNGFNQNYLLLNAGLIKYLMNRRINIALRGFDILNQNTSINRSVYNTRIEDVHFNNLGRYFYLALTYRLAKAGSGSNVDNHPRSTVN